MRRRRARGNGKLWVGVLLAVLAIGGIGHLLLEELRGAGAAAGDAPSADAAPSEETVEAVDAEPAMREREPRRSDTILTCSAADGQVYYTNATRCEDADLDNRVNVLTTPRLPASKPDDCLGAQPGGPRMQGFLPVCQEPFNEALELEAFLLESPDPGASLAARRYCAFITEGVQAGCMATSDQFCFLYLCQAMRESESP